MHVAGLALALLATSLATSPATSLALASRSLSPRLARAFLVCPVQKFPMEAPLAPTLDRAPFSVRLSTPCEMVCEHSRPRPRPRGRLRASCEESGLGARGAPLGLRAPARLPTTGVTSGGAQCRSWPPTLCG